MLIGYKHRLTSYGVVSAGWCINGNSDLHRPIAKIKICSEYYQCCKVADVRSNDLQKTERTRTPIHVIQLDNSAIRDI